VRQVGYLQGSYQDAGQQNLKKGSTKVLLVTGDDGNDKGWSQQSIVKT